MDMEPEAGLVGELLQLDLPQPDTRSIRAAAIDRDRQFAGFRVARSRPTASSQRRWRRRGSQSGRVYTIHDFNKGYRVFKKAFKPNINAAGLCIV